MKQRIYFPRMEGLTSRQAHCDLPDGTYERECGREGFFGSSTHLYHAHPPTGWSAWEGDARPRAFDLTRLPDVAPKPWHGMPVLHNAHMRVRFWNMSGRMEDLVVNGDGGSREKRNRRGGGDDRRARRGGYFHRGAKRGVAGLCG